MTANGIETGRLRLIPATAEHRLVDQRDPVRFGVLLGATIPRNWPPELCDRPDWQRWYLIFKHPVDGSGVLVGVGVSRDQTDAGGVDVAVTVLDPYRRRGIAAEATGMLIGRAFRDPAVTLVTSEVFSDAIPAIGVLVKNGMKAAGPGLEPGVIRYQVSREAWAARAGKAR